MPDTRQLVLASSSLYRRRLLKRLEIPFRWAAPKFEERAPRAHEKPSAYTIEMSLGKAQSLIRRYPDALILGSDQVAVCADEILRKPRTVKRAVDQLLKLSGREHRLVGAVVLIDARSGRKWSSAVTSRLRIRPLTRRQARNYIERERPLDCAGSYKTEGLGITIFDSMRGDDPTALEGMSLISVCRFLREAGVDLLGKNHDG
ncbi:MAG: septum formation protein Maf [Candidatus Eisenbacteria bacterium]|uniref:7-methyl-GTP pyrophosphatase n=1 Tax=Eiseniibacteriota bacterium TaxID=2212470 RepID=A0A948W7K6_UNCEI|nr:septum formation protein Maf [Candidatus Eisenbacteria bacterium]MBU1950642.1 septum formation protein Maf [Candidatus Eisenbacteria bacterium]MBU2691736.1 septum formation protein Maf [Candidatus Eisenbacteria bacterium]